MQFDLLSGQVAPLELTFHSDPGHGWLAVDMAHVRHLNLQHLISPYSYISRDGRTAYLEEDCDAPRYLEAARASGINVVYKERNSNGDSFIRQLPRYPAAREDREGHGLF